MVWVPGSKSMHKSLFGGILHKSVGDTFLISNNKIIDSIEGNSTATSRYERNKPNNPFLLVS